MDYSSKRLFTATIVTIACLAPALVCAASESSTRFDLIGHISQKSGQNEVGVVLLKDTESKKTLVVQIGKGFKIGTTVYHVISMTERGAIISDGHALLHIGDAYTKIDSQPLVRSPDNTESPYRIPKKFRISNRPMNSFKKARLISPAKRGSIQAKLDTQKDLIINARDFREDELELLPGDSEIIEQSFDDTGFGTTSNN